MLTLRSALRRSIESKPDFYPPVCSNCPGPRRIRRRYNSSSPAVQVDLTGLDEPQVYASTSLDPWFNLSFEEWLFRKTPTSTPILYFYRNSPSIIIGRNQNPWKETSPRLLQSQSQYSSPIHLLRRRSGGGAVWHDTGNTNFSLIIPRILFSRSIGAEIVHDALSRRLRLGSLVGINERGDLVLGDEDGGKKKKKISGSAYKIVSGRAYHHGTMLISSDLKDLGKWLKGDFPDIQTKSVDSVRSPVTTLRTYDPAITHERFLQAVAESFWSTFSKKEGDAMEMKIKMIGQEDVLSDVQDGDEERREFIEKGMKELKSWEWVYGQTPEFSQTLEKGLSCGRVSVTLRSKHTKILESSITIDGSEMLQLSERLVGRSYGKLRDGEMDGLKAGEREVWEWLKEVIG